MSPGFPAFLERPDRWYGVMREDYRAAFDGVVEGIAGAFGIRGRLESHPDAVLLVFRR